MTFHDFWVTPFSYGFMQRGLASAVLLSLSGGLLGCILVLRRMALMGDALSHSLLPGIGVAWLVFGPSPAALFVGALLAGLFTALGSAFLSRLTRIKEDAAFGSLFIVLFGAGIALISKLPTQVNLAHFLFGDVLGVGRDDLRLTVAVSGLTVALFSLFHRSILLETFDPIFHRATGGRGGLVHAGFLALTVLNLVAALQTMGVVLALGLFLLPAVSAYLWCDRFVTMLALSMAFAVAGSAAGILLSYHMGLPSGAAIVLSLGCVFLGSALASPRYGLIGQFAGKLRLLSVVAWLAFAVCGLNAAERPLRVVALSTVLADFAHEVGGEHAAVTGILPPGADPHDFEPSPSNLRSIVEADLILASGLRMESYLDRLVANAEPTGRIVAVGDALPRPITLGSGEPDPHWWHSVGNALVAIDLIRAECSRLRPEWSGEFSRNAQAYARRLRTLQAWAAAEIGRLPPPQRRLITSHDAFGYFARDYGFALYPLSGTSPEGTPDARHLARLIDLIRREHVPAVFAEDSVNPRLVQDLVSETGVRLGGILYGDGLGPPGSDATTYEAMIRHNVLAIVAGLGRP